MPAQPVIALTPLELNFQTPVHRRIHRPVMDAPLLEIGPGTPAFHPGAHNRDEIDPAAADGRIAANRLKALAAKYLARARDMLDADKTVVVNLAGKFLEWSPNQSQGRVRLKFFEQEGKIFRIERS